MCSVKAILKLELSPLQTYFPSTITLFVIVKITRHIVIMYIVCSRQCCMYSTRSPGLTRCKCISLTVPRILDNLGINLLQLFTKSHCVFVYVSYMNRPPTKMHNMCTLIINTYTYNIKRCIIYIQHIIFTMPCDNLH